MEHVKDKHLYALFFALLRHHNGQKPLKGISLDDDMKKCLDRTRAERFEKPPAPGDATPATRIKAVLAHIQDCQDCQVKVYEDGPSAKRRLSKAEIEAAEKAEIERRKALKRKFFFSLGYSVPSFFGANYAIVKYRNLTQEKAVAGPTLSAKDQVGIQIHPLQIVFFVLILVTAWGLAECWKIANELWLDWTKAKEAVPVVGKAWAERSNRKKEEEQQRRKLGG